MAIGYKQYVRKLLPKLRSHFLIDEWTIDLAWGLPDSASPSAVAAIDVSDKYLFATLYLGPTMKQRWDNYHYYEFMETMVHELSHIITEPLYDIAIDAVSNSSKGFLEAARERQTQRTANLVMKSIPKSFKDGFNVPVKAKKKVVRRKKK